MAIEKFQIESKSSFPPGIIVPWLGGYFSDGSNGGYTSVEDNSIFSANSFLEKYGWVVCDGSEINNSNSLFFNGSGRYLPNLSDDRFLMGGTSNGNIGGSNTMLDHIHSHSLATSINGNHTHYGAANTFGGNETSWLGGPYLAQNGSTGDSYYRLTDTTTYPNIATSSTSGNHSHSISGTVGSGSSASLTDNRPKYLTCLYIIKVI